MPINYMAPMILVHSTSWWANVKSISIPEWHPFSLFKQVSSACLILLVLKSKYTGRIRLYHGSWWPAPIDLQVTSSRSIQYVVWTSRFCLSSGRMLTCCTFSVLRNYSKCKHIFHRAEKNSASKVSDNFPIIFLGSHDRWHFLRTELLQCCSKWMRVMLEPAQM